MVKGHVFIATSIDGFIARPNGDIDWLDIPGAEIEDHGYDEMMASVDGLIMGRATFEKVLSFDVPWPYEKPVIVLSRTLTAADIPAELSGKVRISSQTPKDLLQTLTEEGWTGAYVDGGQVIQSFLREGLIDDMVISRLPVLIGEGIPLFGVIPKDIRLEHVYTNSYASGLVSSKYNVMR